MGNLLSVQKAFEFAGAKIKIVSTAEEIAEAEALVLPGVGHFADGIDHLNERGMTDVIRNKIAEGTPFMGICLGMQLLLDSSEEAPGKDGLGIIPGKVLKFELEARGLKVPHMGWNGVKLTKQSPLVTEIPEETYFYFVHSYYVEPDDKSFTTLSANYGFEYCAAIQHDNLFATQFHPEKSQEKGLQIIKNYINYVNS